MHIKALEKLGAVFKEEQGILRAETTGLRGNVIRFEKRSVGATQNAVLGAVCAKGNTVLLGCSQEPEVTWLCRFFAESRSSDSWDWNRDVEDSGGGNAS